MTVGYTQKKDLRIVMLDSRKNISAVGKKLFDRRKFRSETSDNMDNSMMNAIACKGLGEKKITQDREQKSV